MSLDQLSSEAAEVVPVGWRVRSVRPRTVDEVRAQLRLSNDLRHRYVSNFSRAPLFGGGGGHHSPLGGYLEHEDLAFVLDAMNTAEWSGPTRGLARFERPLAPAAE